MMEKTQIDVEKPDPKKWGHEAILLLGYVMGRFGLSQQEANDFLWSCTAYPAGDFQYLREQTDELFDRSNGDVEMCLAIVDTELREAMSKYKQSRDA